MTNPMFYRAFSKLYVHGGSYAQCVQQLHKLLFCALVTVLQPACSAEQALQTCKHEHTQMHANKCCCQVCNIHY